MVDFVHHELRALHLAPRLALGAGGRALLEALFAPVRLVLLHRLHHGAHAVQGFVVGRQAARRRIHRRFHHRSLAIFQYNFFSALEAAEQQQQQQHSASERWLTTPQNS